MSINVGSKKKVDLQPYLATAIARNDRAYSRGRIMYYDNVAECESEALKSGLKNHRALTSCRSEYELKARQMLGVLCYYQQEDIISILRRGWSQLYSAVKNDKKPRYSLGEDDDATDLLFVYVYFCTVLNKPIPDEIKPVIVQLTNTYEQESIETSLSSEDKLNGRSAFPSDHLGTAALDDVARTKSGEAFELLAHFMGLGLSDYLYGVRFTIEQRAICCILADGNDELLMPLGYFAQLINAIKSDRRYLLESHAESYLIKAQQAKNNAAKEKQRADIIESEKKEIENSLKEALRRAENAESQVRRLQAELEEHSGDSQELAALRTALYEAEKETLDPVELVLPLPSNINIVCIGGHQRWVAQMKEALPQVTFVSADVSCDEQLIRNADAVWFRADYISHKHFTPAIAVCRSAHKPVYYFSSRGADKCIVELCNTMNGK